MKNVPQDSETTAPFAPANADPRGNIHAQVIRHFGLDPDNIETILPCAPFQRDVLDWAANDERPTVGHVIYEIPKNIDVGSLAKAWEEVVRQTPALRTRTFSSESGDQCQVVLSQSFVWMVSLCLDTETVVEDEAVAAATRAQCNRYALLENPNTNQRLLLWTFSHALVDVAFQERTLRKVLAAYEGKDIQRSTRTEMLPNHATKSPESIAQFWEQHFVDLNASVFPTLPSSVSVPRPSAQSEHRISYTASGQQEWSNITVCKAALAVLLAQYTNPSEGLFGEVVERPPLCEGRGQPIDGPTRTIVPTRVLCPRQQSTSELMQAIASHDIAVGEFAHIGLDGIRHAGDFGSAACGFQTVLVVTAGNGQHASTAFHRTVIESDRFIPCTDRAMLLNCQMTESSAVVLARYDPSVIDALQVARFLAQLGCLIKQFRSHTVNLPIAQLELITAEDRAEIKNWNSGQIQTSEICIHEVIADRAADKPRNPAVFAWDGEWSYGQLDDVSSRLAGYIKSLRLDFGQAVPLCFEKSKWMVLAMLSVLKAGQAFTLIDPSSPPDRIAKICRQVSATVALTSTAQYGNMRTNSSHCIVVDEALLQSLPCGSAPFTSGAKPHDLAYVIFTSGSTGEPKGSLIEHRGFASCSLEFGAAFGINNHSRALQFASYAFGACLVETLTTLMHGGCVCIPSEDDRMNNIPGFIDHAGVNWALFTPSFIGALDPKSVPGVKTLVLGGESISAEIRDTWASQTRLLYAYGQSETSTICSVAQVDPDTVDLNNVGCGTGARLWITGPNDINQLAPIGGIGELIIESPGVAKGYVVAAPQDKTPFLTAAPAWSPPSSSSVSDFTGPEISCVTGLMALWPTWGGGTRRSRFEDSAWNSVMWKAICATSCPAV